MGCFQSVPVNYEGETYQPPEKKKEAKEAGKASPAGGPQYVINPNIEQALNNARASAQMGAGMRGPSASGISLTLPTGAPSVSGRTSRKSQLGADLHSIMDDQGMLNPLVSRQLSVLSHYSVRSESGSVMITPEDGGAPFKLLRLIGRGGFGNVYLGGWYLGGARGMLLSLHGVGVTTLG